jgi:RNA polymerase primary sigma factor
MSCSATRAGGIDEIAASAKHSEAAREELVASCMPLIASRARVYRGVPGVERAELLQEGVVGLLRALERYDPETGTPFWAYASWWVRQAMQQLVAELTRSVVLSDRALRQLARVNRSRRRLLQRERREPTALELAQDSGVALTQLQRLLAVERRASALDEPVTTADGAGSTLGEMVADPAAEEAYDRIPGNAAAQRLPAALADLSQRERMIVCDRFGFDGPERTLSELAQRLGVSAERVRQIEERSLAKLTRQIDPDLAERGVPSVRPR